MKKLVAANLAFALLAALPLLAGEIKLGKPVKIASPTPIKSILSQPDKYLGKDVRVEGEITEVCQNMGCWINIKDASTNDVIQIKVDDGVIVFPKDAAGKQVVAQGKVEKVAVSKEELERQAMESGRKVDTSRITAGKVVYRLKGEGAIIRD